VFHEENVPSIPSPQQDISLNISEAESLKVSALNLEQDGSCDFKRKVFCAPGVTYLCRVQSTGIVENLRSESQWD
jgi:hypothetical protein